MLEAMPEIKEHAVTVDKRRQINVTGVTDVFGFDENSIVLGTEAGRMAVEGEGLQITALDVESGKLTASGKIDSVIYSDKEQKGRGFFSRLIK